MTAAVIANIWGFFWTLDPQPRKSWQKFKLKSWVQSSVEPTFTVRCLTAAFMWAWSTCWISCRNPPPGCRWEYQGCRGLWAKYLLLSCTPQPWNETFKSGFLQKLLNTKMFRTCLGISWRTALARLSRALGASSSCWKSAGSRLPQGRYVFRSANIVRDEIYIFNKLFGTMW